MITLMTVTATNSQSIQPLMTLGPSDQPTLQLINCLRTGTLIIDQRVMVLKPMDLVVVRHAQTLTWQPLKPKQVAVCRVFTTMVDLRHQAPLLVAGDNPLFEDLLVGKSAPSTYLVFHDLTNQLCQGYCDQLARLAGLTPEDRYVAYQYQAVTKLLLTELLRIHVAAGSLTDSRFPARAQIRYTKQSTQGGSIMTYLNDHLATATLARVAAYFGYQPNYFSRLFKQIFKQSFSTKLIQMRIERGQQLLALTDQTVTRISHAVGYQNTANFNQHFKQVTQVTPTEYRLSLQ